MATSKSVWKGQLRLSLVSLAVDLHSARDSSSGFGFRQIHAPSGKPVAMQKTVPGIGPVEDVDIKKGFEIAKDEYVLLEDQEIEAISVPSKDAIDLSLFVQPEQIDELLYDKAYFVLPSSPDDRMAYAVLREAMIASGKVGIGRLTMRSGEDVVVVRPFGDGLLLETLHYAGSIREAADRFDDLIDVSPPQEAVELASQLIRRKSGTFQPLDYEDGYRTEIMKLVEAKLGRGEATTRTTQAAVARTRSEDLLTTLRRSIKAPAKASGLKRASRRQ